MWKCGKTEKWEFQTGKYSYVNCHEPFSILSIKSGVLNAKSGIDNGIDRMKLMFSNIHSASILFKFYHFPSTRSFHRTIVRSSTGEIKKKNTFFTTKKYKLCIFLLSYTYISRFGIGMCQPRTTMLEP